MFYSWISAICTVLLENTNYECFAYINLIYKMNDYNCVYDFIIFFYFKNGNYYGNQCKFCQSKRNEIKLILANAVINNIVKHNSNITINKYSREYICAYNT